MLYTYDPKLLLVIFGETPIFGFSEGTFLSIVRNEDMFTTVVGADGETSRAKSNNRSGTATLTLKQTSPANDALTKYMLADEEANLGVRPFLAKDGLGTTLMFTAAGYVQKMPDVSFAKEITDREWTIFLSDLRVFVGGSIPVSV